VRPAGVAIPDELAPRAAIHAEVTVEVQDAPVGLLVSVDGSEPGPLPIRLQKGSGQHRLVFQAPGHRSRTMKLDATRDLSLVLSLAKLPDAPGAKGAKGGKGSTSPPPAAAPSITKKSNAFTDL
jgi:hypothetical protein